MAENVGGTVVVQGVEGADGDLVLEDGVHGGVLQHVAELGETLEPRTVGSGWKLHNHGFLQRLCLFKGFLHNGQGFASSMFSHFVLLS